MTGYYIISDPVISITGSEMIGSEKGLTQQKQMH